MKCASSFTARHKAGLGRIQMPPLICSGRHLAARATKLNPRHDFVSTSKNTGWKPGDTAAKDGCRHEVKPSRYDVLVRTSTPPPRSSNLIAGTWFGIHPGTGPTRNKAHVR
jgi:hypothetical protein